MYFEVGTLFTGHKHLMVSFLPPETTAKVKVILLSNQQQILPLLSPVEHGDGNRSIFQNTMRLSLSDDRHCPHNQSSPLLRGHYHLKRNFFKLGMVYSPRRDRLK